MNQITQETRFASYKTRPQQNRYAEILKALGEDELTARQIAYKLGYQDLNAVKPRLTELRKKGIIVAVGKALDLTTGRYTAIYERSTN